jgi:adenylosuccinate synthase
LEILRDVKVNYETLPGWKCDISKARKFEDLPTNAKKYVLRCEELIGCQIRWVSVGPERDAFIFLD